MFRTGFDNYKKEVYSKMFDVLFYGGIIMLVACTIILLRQFVEEGYNLIVFFSWIIILLFFISIVFVGYSMKKKFKEAAKEREILITKGKRLEAKIERILENRTYYEKGSSINYCALVSFECNGKNYQITTPYLNFSPELLISEKVYVYIYDEKFYVDNYKINYEKQEKNKKSIVFERKFKKKLFVIMFVFMTIIMWLACFEQLDSEIIGILFLGFELVIAIAAGVLTLKSFK